MKIKDLSRKVLQKLYDIIVYNENSYCFSVEFEMKGFAESLNMSKERLNLCLWYLRDLGYISGDLAYNKSDSAIKQITSTAQGIQVIES